MINESLILDPESLLDSRESSQLDGEKELKALSKARALRKGELASHDIRRARLLQLKWKNFYHLTRIVQKVNFRYFWNFMWILSTLKESSLLKILM